MNTLRPPEIRRSAQASSAAHRPEIAGLSLQLAETTDTELRASILVQLSCAYERFDLREAWALVEQALREAPTSAAGLQRRGELAAKNGQFVVAAESLAAAGERWAESDAAPAAALLLRAASFAAKAGRLRESERLLLRARALRGHEPSIFERLGELACARGDESGAESFLIAAELAHQAGAPERALRSLWRAHALAPSHVEVTVRLAERLAEDGELVVATELLRTLPRTDASVAHRLAISKAQPELWLFSVLDAELDLEPFAERPDGLFAALSASGIWEPLALLHESRAMGARRSQQRAQAAEHFLQAAQIWAGPLANPERALWLMGDALALGAGSLALDLLVGWAGIDRPSCIHLLLKILSGAGDAGGDRSRERAARELWALALRAERPVLAGWALSLLSSMTSLSEEEERERIPLEAQATAARERGIELLRKLDREPDAQTLDEALLVLADLPDFVAPYERAVRQKRLVNRADPKLAAEAYGLAFRRDDHGECLEVLRTVRAPGHPELFLAEWHALRTSDGVKVVEHVRQGLTLGSALGAAAAWVEAAQRRDLALRAEALVAYAEHLGDWRSRAALWSVAAEEEARRDSGLALSLARAAHGKSKLLAPTRLRAALETDADARVLAMEEWFVRWPSAVRGEALAKEWLVVAGHGGRELDAIVARVLELYPSHAAHLFAAFELGQAGSSEGALRASVEAAIDSLLPSAAVIPAVTFALTKLAIVEAEEQAQAPGASVLELAERALDVLGPAPELTSALLDLADKRQAFGLVAKILQVEAAAIGLNTETNEPTAAGAAAVDNALVLARLGRKAKDRELEAWAWASAARAGGAQEPVMHGIERLLRDRERLSGDAELVLLQAVASLAELRHEPARAVRALRALFEARHRLLGHLSLEVIESATAIAPELAPRAFANDLLQSLGPDATAKLLGEVAAAFASRPFERGALLAEAARAYTLAGAERDAFATAMTALHDNPARTFALDLCERASSCAQSIEELSPLYTHVANSAMGRFGRSAAHYRGARFFMARGEHTHALTHMAKGFAALPSDGAALVALTRAARSAPDALPAVRVLEELAESAPEAQSKAGWLLRAALLLEPQADSQPRREEAQVRFDLTLRALAASPTPTAARVMAEAAAALAHQSEESRALVSVRLERAVSFVMRDLEGPDAARMALILADVVLEHCGPRLALPLVSAALRTVGDLEEFAALTPRASELLAWEDRAEARAALLALLEACAAPFMNLGREAAQLLWALAQAAFAQDLPEDDERCRLGVLASLLLAERPDDDDEIQSREDAVLLPRLAELWRNDDDKLAPRIAKVLSRYHSALEGATERARAIEAEGDPHSALTAWIEVAERGDSIGSPDQRAERWGEVLRLAELTDITGEAARALLRLGELRQGPARREVKKRLARLLEREGEAERAWALWSALYEEREGAAPIHDEEVEQALERRVGGDRRLLLEHLARRAERMQAAGASRDAVRAVRLRRIAMLEQHGLGDEAERELRQLQREFPDNASTLRYLADLLERRGKFEESLSLWHELSRRDPLGDDLEPRVLRLQLRCGAAESVLEHLDRALAERPRSAELLALKVEALRALGLHEPLGTTLELLSEALPDGDPKKVLSLLQAAQAAARNENMYLALNLAERASAMDGAGDEATLMTLALEYRLRGAGSPDEGQVMVDRLVELENLGTEDAALRSFLLAEALDVVEGHGAGYRELAAALEELGPNALLSVGLAERHAKRFQFEEALPHYEQALGGELYGLRRTGDVALGAAEAAFRLHEIHRGWELLEQGFQDPKVREAALRRMFHVAVETVDVSRTMRAVHGMIALAAPEARLERTYELGKVLLDSEHASLSVEGSALLEQIWEELPAGEQKDALRKVLRKTPVPHRLAFHELERLRQRSIPPGPQVVGDLQARLEQGSEDAVRALEKAAHQGSAGAADTLADYYERRALARTSIAPPAPGAPLAARVSSADPNALRYRLLSAALSPLDSERIERLRRIALADHNPTFARALDHVQRAFDPAGGPLRPPPLVVQSEQPGFTALLAGGFEPLLRAHGELWSTVGPQILYALRGKDPLPPRLPLAAIAPGSAAAALLDVALRLLNAPKALFFASRSPASDALGFVADLDDVPRIWLAGQLGEDSPQLRYCLGFALAAIFPENAMLLALSDDEGSVVHEAVWRAFGPNAANESQAGLSGKVAPLVDLLWQIVPGRVQRHVQVLLEKEERKTYAQAQARARLSGLRLALFLTGDFGFTLRAYAESLGLRQELTTASVAALLRERTELLELYRLALRPEYADARWQDPTSAQRVRLTSGTMRAV